jgi:hypothetical protein
MADVVDQVTYTISFTGTGLLPAAGSFTWDPDTTSFTSFSVTWNTLSFDFLVDPNSGPNDPLYFNTFGPAPCLGAATGASASFALLTGACTPASPGYTTEWEAVGGGNTLGTFDFKTFSSDPNAGAIDVFREVSQDPSISTQAAHGEWSVASNAAPAPEPSSLLLAALSLCVLVARKRFALSPAPHSLSTFHQRQIKFNLTRRKS